MKRIAKVTILLILTAMTLALQSNIYGFAYAAPDSAPSAYYSSTYYPAPAAAEQQTSYRYAMATVKDAYFFTQKDVSTSLFAIPYTYCVEILRDDGDWYYVKYAEDTGIYKALYGYCLAKDFTPVDYRPESLYLYKPLTVTYRAEDPLPNLPVLNELTIEAAFYGTYYAGATAYSYVLCEGSYGYITGANDDYPLNELPQTEPEQPAAPVEKEGGVNTSLITALVLAALAACALILLFFTARKHSRKMP